MPKLETIPKSAMTGEWKDKSPYYYEYHSVIKRKQDITHTYNNMDDSQNNYSKRNKSGQKVYKAYGSVCKNFQQIYSGRKQISG